MEQSEYEKLYGELTTEQEQPVEELDSYLDAFEEATEDTQQKEFDNYQIKEGPDDEDIEDFDDLEEIDSEDEDDFFDFFPSDAGNYVTNTFKKSLKQGVNVSGISNNLVSFFDTFNSKVGNGLKITSGNDSKHMTGSKHYKNKAIDIGANSSDRASYLRFKSIIKDPKLLQQTKQAFGIEDIIDEGDHIHIELAQIGGEIDYAQHSYQQTPFHYNVIGSQNSSRPGININRPQDYYNVPGGLNVGNSVQGYGAVTNPIQITPPDITPEQQKTIDGLDKATSFVDLFSKTRDAFRTGKSIIAQGLDTGITTISGILGDNYNQRAGMRDFYRRYGEKPSDYYNKSNRDIRYTG